MAKGITPAEFWARLREQPAHRPKRRVHVAELRHPRTGRLLEEVLGEDWRECDDAVRLARDAYWPLAVKVTRRRWEWR